MIDLISRQDVIQAIENLNIPEDMCTFEIKSHLDLAIGSLPSVQVKEKTGKWMGTVCSACGNSCSYEYDAKYCPNCGAKKMETGDVYTEYDIKAVREAAEYEGRLRA